MSVELEKQAGGEVAEVSPEVEALLARQQAEVDDAGLFQTPILKIGQPLTKEVRDDAAEAGEFIDTLTGDGLGDKLEFIVAHYGRGRFAANRDTGRAYVAFSDTIPQSWEDLVGEEFVDTPFNEYPDAEERFKERVNAKEIKWGHGPLVSTTHNFTGLAIVSPEEGSEEPDELKPVRLSLQRTNIPAAQKFLTLRRAVLLNRPFWDIVFDLSTFKKEFSQGEAYLLNVRQGRKTSTDERQKAVQLALAADGGRTVDNAEAAAEGDKLVEPDAEGGAEL